VKAFQEQIAAAEAKIVFLSKLRDDYLKGIA